MQEYDSEYYLVTKPMRAPHLPSLVPDENTEGRSFDTKAQPVNSPPLVFLNGRKVQNLANGISSVAPSILFAGTDLVVVGVIREKLLLADIPNLSMHRAVYIDDKDVRHEDRWYLTFTADFDCWDRQKSEFGDSRVKVAGAELFDVYTFRFINQTMASTPFASRRLFKIGGALEPVICCHRELSSIFLSEVPSGAELVNLDDQ